MKKYFCAFMLFLAVLPAFSQVYEADYIIGRFIRAYYVNDDGQRMRRMIPNGTPIEVTGRVVRGDSTDCRNILAEFSQDGKQFTTEARWLRFSDTNPEGTPDIFASDNFSRAPEFVAKRLQFTHINPLSYMGRWLYGIELPAMQLVLMLLACWLLMFKGKVALSSVPFILATGMQFFASLCMGDDYLWYCLPEYQGIGGAILGFFPLAIFCVAQVAYMVSVWGYSDKKVKIWPVIVAWIFLYPAVVISARFASAWLGVAIAVLFPLLINDITKMRQLGVTLLLEIGMMGVVASFSAIFLTTWQIIAAVIAVYFSALMSVGAFLKIIEPFLRGGSIVALPYGGYHADNQTFATREEAEAYLKDKRARETARALREEQQKKDRELERFIREHNPW